jgi:ubiquinone/menaquinone biosynthesis C-methylase UbiE
MQNLELLSPSLLIDHPEKVREVEQLQRALWREIGWHYLVDLVWVLHMIEKLNLPPGARILDAGAGRGLLQYLLANRGYNIVSVDYYPFNPPFLAKLAFPHQPLRTSEQIQTDDYQDHLAGEQKTSLKIVRLFKRLSKIPFNPIQFMMICVRRLGLGLKSLGTILWFQHDMRNMVGIPDQSIDAVVSISSIEHLPREDLKKTIREFERVLKVSGSMIITTSAAESQDWVHTPSRGLCFSPSTLIDVFSLPRSKEYSQEVYRDILRSYKDSRFLERKLGSGYYVSGNNGMPWGVWNPEYIPVGIVKTVSSRTE